MHGHMHLLGKSIKVEVNPGTPKAQTVLDVPAYNFDDQGARKLAVDWSRCDGHGLCSAVAPEIIRLDSNGFPASVSAFSSSSTCSSTSERPSADRARSTKIRSVGGLGRETVRV